MSDVALGAWLDRAACIDTPTDLFFLTKGELAQPMKVAAAKSLCHSCPVILDCREHAFSRPEATGIWGGLTPYERGFHSAFQRNTRLTQFEVRRLLRGDDL